MRGRKSKAKWLSIVLTLVMCVPLIFPPTAGAANSTQPALSSDKPYTSVKDSAKVSPQSKITSKLQDQFKKEKHVTYLVKFKEQVDTESVAKKATEKAQKQKLSTNSKKLLKRNMVVSELRSTALETQAEVKKYLNKNKKSGDVKEFNDFYVVNGMAVTSTKGVMEKIADFPEVEKILPNETRQLIQPAKADTSSVGVMPKGKEAGNNTSSIGWNIDHIGAPAVWGMGIDGAGTVVASIDTGVQWNHPALKEKYRGFDPQNPESPAHEFNWFDATAGQGAPYDDQGHGTHVTGTMVGSEPDGSNQIGVAPGAKWIAVKAFTADGGTDVDLLEAGEWILAPKDAEGNPHPEMAPDVVNNSWGGGPGLDDWYREMVAAWRAAEIFPEFSAGNTTQYNSGGPGSIATPANYPESFATGATDINDKLGSFSLQGPSPYEEVKPEISAPGVNIRSSVPGSNYEGGWNGTSMAGPHVSAVVALMKQANASLTVEEIEEILIDTAVPLTDDSFPESPNNGYGHGLVNAFDAVSSITSGLGKIKGQVLKGGEDEEAPAFDHTAQEDTYANRKLPLTIDVQDNISISSVTLQYVNQSGDWADTEAERTSGSLNDGTYTASIPGEEIAEPSVSYRFQIVDFGGNEVTTETYEVSVKPGITLGYFQDFESEPVDWYSYGVKDSWEWGKPRVGVPPFSGANVYGTNLWGNYDNDANMTLAMPPIDLPEDSPAYLQFMSWHWLYTNQDFGTVFVSTDEENWTQLLRFSNSNLTWEAEEIDLSEYAGERIYIGFNVTTNDALQRNGWYLDDVALSAESIEEEGSNKAQLGVQPDKPEKAAVKDKKVDPDKIQPVSTPVKEETKEAGINPNALPLNAQVTVVETGRTVNTLLDGQYELTHAAGTYTVKAESYGYHSSEQKVEIPEDGEVVANFTLEEKDYGTLSGTISNSSNGEPVANATLLLMEDASVAPVTTDGNGNFSITAYEGDYTLRVLGPSYYSENVKVNIEGNTDTEFNLELRPFIGYPGEIGYDDGTAEDARAFYEAGDGWAVKMSLPEGKEKALVTGGLFRFWETDWPNPGGTDFKVAVYDASGADGAPGQKIAGPFDATALRNGEWTNVDLSKYGIVVEKDFYLVYIQADPYPDSPGLSTDNNGKYAARGWQMVDGAWTAAREELGNFMIRAIVNYEVNAPVITSPKDNSFTKHETVTVEGTSAPNITVHLFNGKDEVATAETTEEGTFSADLSLQTGENTITAKASTEAGITGPSEPVTITLDQVKPELAITSPKEGIKTNREAITVEGTISDENLAWVKVNGEKATVNDGQFTHRLLLSEGENVIQVVANDKAGNKKKQSFTVDAKFGDITIDNLQPSKDKELKKGESVKIEFDSEPGLDATFVIQMPLTNARAQVSNANDLPMMETSEGHYVGYYTATSNVKAPGAVIEVKVSDDYGNVTTKRAEGKLYINSKK
ncbi:S8 family serine peptidase [Rossellomorea yichunensis]|uniref:S8 family serine peptidase n=1 Tax=Rossellomorea yichunensis TaxID=3077331 RepID=UPI0028DF4A12|nr:S8 family serine peptidase [Rossellomorea sp. YC4-1]MDT9025557.1 S8 family serine peptidase [Rossellomorea sp. YC4-1]